MIVVKVELWSANTGAQREIGRLYMTNDGTGTRSSGNYDVAVCRKGTVDIPPPCGRPSPKKPKATRTGRVERYPRARYNVWRLVARGLLSAFPEEAKGTAPTFVDGDEEPIACAEAATKMDAEREWKRVEILEKVPPSYRPEFEKLLDEYVRLARP